jgi:hypothetical protein
MLAGLHVGHIRMGTVQEISERSLSQACLLTTLRDKTPDYLILSYISSVLGLGGTSQRLCSHGSTLGPLYLALKLRAIYAKISK